MEKLGQFFSQEGSPHPALPLVLGSLCLRTPVGCLLLLVFIYSQLSQKPEKRLGNPVTSHHGESPWIQQRVTSHHREIPWVQQRKQTLCGLLRQFNVSLPTSLDLSKVASSHSLPLSNLETAFEIPICPTPQPTVFLVTSQQHLKYLQPLLCPEGVSE